MQSCFLYPREEPVMRAICSYLICACLAALVIGCGSAGSPQEDSSGPPSKAKPVAEGGGRAGVLDMDDPSKGSIMKGGEGGGKNKPSGNQEKFGTQKEDMMGKLKKQTGGVSPF